MKIIVIANYIYESNHARFSKNKTGYGIMVKEIASALSINNSVGLLSNVITPRDSIDGVSIYKHLWKDIFCSVKVCDVINSLKAFFLASGGTLLHRLKCAYYAIDCGYVRKILLSEKPEIVHIHDVGMRQKLTIEMCEELGIKYVITLHLLIGLDKSCNSPGYAKKMEYNLFTSDFGKYVSVISTGMKERILRAYGERKKDQITVINNGTGLVKISPSEDIYIKYGIKKCKKIILCVGNISKRKNQVQVVRAVSKLNHSDREKIHVLILGEDLIGGELERTITNLNMQDFITCCGFVEHNLMYNYYAYASYIISASLDEGFGLSFIEGYVYGIPAIAFSDLDSIADVYSPEVMELAYSRTDDALSEAISRASTRSWDREVIKVFAEKYSLARMANNYEKLFKQIIKNEV